MSSGVWVLSLTAVPSRSFTLQWINQCSFLLVTLDGNALKFYLYSFRLFICVWVYVCESWVPSESENVGSLNARMTVVCEWPDTVLLMELSESNGCSYPLSHRLALKILHFVYSFLGAQARSCWHLRALMYNGCKFDIMNICAWILQPITVLTVSEAQICNPFVIQSVSLLFLCIYCSALEIARLSRATEIFHF